MIKQYFLVLILTYMEYFILWFLFEHRNKISWDGIKFWLKYPPFISLFFFLIDSWIVATMIYITFFFPYVLIAYCMKTVNKEVFGLNKIIIKARFSVNSSFNK